jgi:hypothetical protein
LSLDLLELFIILSNLLYYNRSLLLTQFVLSNMLGLGRVYLLLNSLLLVY